jgi:hypothetical protein
MWTDSMFYVAQVVLREDQADRGGEEAAAGAERARRLPHQGLRVQEERLLALSQGRRHRQTLPHQVTEGQREIQYLAAGYLPITFTVGLMYLGIRKTEKEIFCFCIFFHKIFRKIPFSIFVKNVLSKRYENRVEKFSRKGDALSKLS